MPPFNLISHYDVQAVIEADNVAAGICFGFFLAAQGAVARLALAGASSDILGELVTVGVYALLGTVLLCAGRYAADKVLLPASPLDHEIARDGNMAAAAVVAATLPSLGRWVRYSVLGDAVMTNMLMRNQGYYYARFPPSYPGGWGFSSTMGAFLFLGLIVYAASRLLTIRRNF